MDELKYVDGKFTVNGADVSGLTPILSAQTYELSDNPEYLEVKVDNEGKIIEGVKKDGTKYIGEIESNTIKNIFNIANENKKDIQTLKKSIIPKEDTIIVNNPGVIYTTCDVSQPMSLQYKGTSLNLYLSRLLLLTKYTNLYFKSTGNIYSNISSRRYPMNGSEAKLYGISTDFANFDEDRHVVNIEDSIIGPTIEDFPFTYTHRSTKSSVSVGKFIPILQIGDSVTEGTNANLSGSQNLPVHSWAYIKYFFEKDNLVDNGNRKIILVGSHNKESFNIEENNYVACAEGRGGWTTKGYLYQKTFSDGNVFYDDNKRYIDSELSEVRFSIKKWIDRYRTMDDSGNRLYFDSLGSTKGTPGDNIGYYKDGTQSPYKIGSLVSDTLDKDVCLPKVVIIQLGFNDGRTSATFQRLMIKAIKEEYPNIIIALSSIDAAGTYFPEKWDGWHGLGKDISFLEPMDGTKGYGYCKRLHDFMFYVFREQKELVDEENGIYLVSNNMIEPTAWSVPFGHNDEPGAYPIKGYLANDWTDPIDGGMAYAYHPNNQAHACWGYQLYSFINYISNKL